VVEDAAYDIDKIDAGYRPEGWFPDNACRSSDRFVPAIDVELVRRATFSNDRRFVRLMSPGLS
jgi:hypothetical protein